MDNPSDLEYRNKFIFNQRGGSLEINNSTEREEVKLSQFSGSNVTINNVVNSELATNNKQTKVLFDEFKTVGNSSNEYVGTDRTLRVAENSYEVKGITSQAEINAIKKWREIYRPIANKNAQFWINRGGLSYPYPNTSVIETTRSGTRASNPDLKQTRLELNNTFYGYSKVPDVKSRVNEVTSFSTVIRKDENNSAVSTSPTVTYISTSFGSSGSNAPGVILFGPEFSSATQDGNWVANTNKTNLVNDIVSIQDQLTTLEQNFGAGGDEVEYIKRNKVQVIGGALNDYASIRVDTYGRSQPTEVGVSQNGVFNHNDYVPHVEEVDNSSNFVGGNYNLTVSNKYNLIVGSGGIQLKTSGGLTIGASIVKIGATEVNISGSAGVVVGSSEHIDIFSPKIQLRSTRQIYAYGSFGVLNNLIVGGGTLINGELYVNHITAPTEVQETMDTTVYGELVPDQIIGYVQDGIVYSVDTPNTVKTYSHSHHFNNIPLRLTTTNNDMRGIAAAEGINKPLTPVSALKQIHARK